MSQRKWMKCRLLDRPQKVSGVALLVSQSSPGRFPSSALVSPPGTLADTLSAHQQTDTVILRRCSNCALDPTTPSHPATGHRKLIMSEHSHADNDRLGPMARDAAPVLYIAVNQACGSFYCALSGICLQTSRNIEFSDFSPANLSRPARLPSLRHCVR